MKDRTSLTAVAAAMLVLASAGMARAQTAIHLTQAEAVKNATTKSQPEYPMMAKQLHLEGAVQLQAHISESGNVEGVTPLTGNPVLMSAAVSAVKRWKFTPFTSEGKPTRAVTDLSFSFKM